MTGLLEPPGAAPALEPAARAAFRLCLRVVLFFFAIWPAYPTSEWRPALVSWREPLWNFFDSRTDTGPAEPSSQELGVRRGAAFWLAP